jgi:hypothetical protein
MLDDEGSLHFGEPPQPEGRCTNDRRSRLHRFEALATRRRATQQGITSPLGHRLNEVQQI